MTDGTTQINFLWAIITMLATILGFFLVRYISRKDKRDDDVIKKLQEHDKKALKQAEQIEEVAKEMSQYVLKMQQTGVKFERAVNQEISAIRKETSEIKSLVLEAKSSCEIVSERMSAVRNEMVALFETVKAHANSLSLGAKTIHRHDQEIKTLYKKLKLSEDATLLTETKKPDKK